MAEIGGLRWARSPESVGFDADRLARLDDYMAGMVAAGYVAGTSTLIVRHGQVVAFRTFGQACRETAKALSDATIFRIYSMTKPLTGVAMMILHEEGRWTLDEPVTKVLPELAEMKVCTGLDAAGAMTLEAASRPPTFRELMSHTAGLGYGLFDNHPVERAYRKAEVLGAVDLEEMLRRVVRLPLLFQPGGEWFYSVATDLQALVVQRLSGMSFGSFLKQRIFDPLGMADTGFHAPMDKAPRLATLYADDGKGGLKVATDLFSTPVSDATRPPSLESGGGGLLSTAGDYARFCQMVLNRGELDGVRILAPVSLELMAANVIPDAVLATPGPLRLLPFNPAFGFGLGFSVALDPRRLGWSEGRGTLSWGGAGGTWFWIDPENDLFFIGMIQRVADPVSSEFRAKSRVFTYQALTRPER